MVSLEFMGLYNSIKILRLYLLRTRCDALTSGFVILGACPVKGSNILVLYYVSIAGIDQNPCPKNKHVLITLIP